MPKLHADELPADDHEESKESSSVEMLRKIMTEFVDTTLHRTQLVYDLMPLASVIGTDPYLNSFEQGKKFMASYKSMMDRLFGELVR